MDSSLKKRARATSRGSSRSSTPATPHSHKVPKIEALTPKISSGQYPELLSNDGSLRLRIGIDFGTSNTCAAFVVVSPAEEGIFDYLNRIDALHALNGNIRFPTVMAILPSKRNPSQATLIFAKDATEALGDGDISPDHMFEYPKLGLVNHLDADKDVLLSIHARHDAALNHAKSFKELRVRYPGREEEVTTLDKIDDVIVTCLKYFLCLLRASIAVQLKVSDDQLDHIFERKTEVGFAVPASWRDTMLHDFIRHISTAGWPSHCRLWSEPKCALASYVATKLAKVSPIARDAVWSETIKTIIMVDVGSGTTDLASIKPTRLNEKVVEFESIAASSGSLCGARLLDFYIEHHLRTLLGQDLQFVREFVSDDPDVPISEEEFFHGFDFENCRQNFDGSRDEYAIRYRGNNLPSKKLKCMTQRAIKLPKEHMIAAHRSHADRVINHIEQQIEKTQKALEHENDRNIEVLLIGGVTHSPFFSKLIQEKFSGRSGVTVPGSVEDFIKPLIPVGCILSLAQPAIGGRYLAKEAYGVPIIRPYDPKIHDRASRRKRTDGRKGWEVDDLMDWMTPIGGLAEKRVRVYQWECSIYTEEWKPYTKDPRKDASLFPIKIQPNIWSTVDDYWGRQQHFAYKKVPEVKQRQFCAIELNLEQCLQMKGTGVGFCRTRSNGYWSFRVPVRITLRYPDVRTSWTAEIPQCGYFTEDPDQPVWSQEVTFAAVEQHGINVGEEMTDEEILDAPEEDSTVT